MFRWSSRIRTARRSLRRPSDDPFVRACTCSAPARAPEQSNGSAAPDLEPTKGSIAKPAADHRDIGKAQSLFTFSPYSPGSPLFLPNGAAIFSRMADFLRAQYRYFGFREVVTPTIYKKSLWEKSGHWDNYADDMFTVRGRGASGEKDNAEIGEDEEFGLKPMNCPGHCLLFADQNHSYRDLPVRYADFSPLHRNEISGALSGLTRVRRFHQDDGHIFCRPSQILEEITNTLQFVGMVYKTFGMDSYRLVLSTRPEDHFIGTQDEWDRAENQLKQALDASGREWSLSKGDGAFYGPKIDIILKDSDGKEHQTATVQLDFQLPQRFGLKYNAPAPEFEKRGETTADTEELKVVGPVTPVLVHRAVLGSLERFMAIVVEKYGGKWPFWLSPRPAIVLCVTGQPEVLDYADEVRQQLSGVRASSKAEREPQPLNTPSFHVDVDSSARSLKKKIVEARERGYNFIVVVGSRDISTRTVNITMASQRQEDEAWKLMDSHALKKTQGNLTAEFKVQEARAYFERLIQSYL